MKPKLLGLSLPVLLAVGSATAQTSCSRSITSCGCTITRSGVYSVDADLSASQGLTALNGCIDINAEHVDLFVSLNQSISGEKTGTGVGIHVLPAAKYAFLFFQSYYSPPVISGVSGWQFGIESEADNVIINGAETFGNSTGVLLKGTYNNKLSGVGLSTTGAINNSAYGIWIVGGNSSGMISKTSDNDGNRK